MIYFDDQKPVSGDKFNWHPVVNVNLGLTCFLTSSIYLLTVFDYFSPAVP